MLTSDYHLHSILSADGDVPLAEMAQAALDAGLTDVCFTEHLDFDREDPGYGYTDWEVYAAAIAEARERFAGRLTIRMGLEFDFRRAYGDEPRRVLETMPCDFLLGSVHSAAGVHIYGLYKESEADLARLDLAALYRAYFDEVEALVATGWCHALGHFDYLYKQAPGFFGPRRDKAYWDRVDAILAACVATGTGLEINSHHVEDRGFGLAADSEIVRRYHAMGGRRLTVGSDAHRPGDVAAAYDRVARVLKDVGVTAVTGYEAGQPYDIAP